MDHPTERVHDSQPVQVRPAETPGSAVARPSVAEEIPCRRSDEVPERGRATGRSAASSEACSVVTPHPARDQGGAEPVGNGRRPRKATQSLERSPRNPPAYGEWNGRNVVMGAGRASSAPHLRDAGSDVPPITGRTGKWWGGREAVGGGHGSDDRRDNITRRERRAPASSTHL